jgi:Mrp family chromosome partitioning ATPase
MGGSRVVLIDADLRNPKVHRYFKLRNREGLSNVLAGVTELGASMQKVKLDDYLPNSNGRRPAPKDPRLHGDLRCITAGTLPPNPAELLASAHMRDLLAELEGRADYLVVDSPPLLPVADALALASLLDTVILVGRAGRSSSDEAREVKSLLSRVEARTLGVIMLGQPSGNRYYGYGQIPDELHA